MEIGEMLGDSFEYTREGLVGKWKKWILLIICSIIFPLMGGYAVRIYKGARPAPEVDDWVGMFIDGIKLLIIGFVYALPIILVGAVLIGGSIFAFTSSNSAANVAGVGVLLLGLLIVFILTILISLIAVLGMVRFARKDSMGEAFNFSEILKTIGNIGWVEYIIALVVLWIVMVVVQSIIAFLLSIPVIGWIIGLFIGPAAAIFSARYMTVLYESGTPA